MTRRTRMRKKETDQEETTENLEEGNQEEAKKNKETPPAQQGELIESYKSKERDFEEVT